MVYGNIFYQLSKSQPEQFPIRTDPFLITIINRNCTRGSLMHPLTVPVFCKPGVLVSSTEFVQALLWYKIKPTLYYRMYV